LINYKIAYFISKRVYIKKIMTEGNFVDYVKIQVSSGKGGQGSAHLHREKFIEKGGPDGGDGGRGGHVIIRASSNLWTLLHLKFKRHARAGHGGSGSKSRSTGADGEDVYIDVPLGTVVKDTETDETLFEITEDGEEQIIAQGGRGGLGNWHFKNSRNQTFVMADIPGIIEGAAEGKGLGHYFLRHIERNSILLFLIPADAKDIRKQYDILLDELRRYNPEMLDKERMIAISKSDMLDDELQSELANELDKTLPIEYMFISSIAQKGIVELKDKLWKMLNG
jgi:GTPase involved in cell partitioning and DNA repair